MARTLTQIQTDLDEAYAALSAARRAVSYSQGDRQVNRAGIVQLRQEVAYLEREKRQVTAGAAGANNPMFVTPKWS